MQIGWGDFERLPQAESVSDFHCVEGWSVQGCRWRGVKLATLVQKVRPRPEAKHVLFACSDGYTTSLPFVELLGDDVLLAWELDGKLLHASLGGPVRLIAPSKYAYKSAMWVERITFLAENELGYWEKRGYSDTADVWKNDRYTK
jgi:DMSO/TMAO reductase YedYZ molybdopterin-dependent catalytic subunit